MNDGEERGAADSRAGWLILLAMCAALVGWGILNYALVRDRPREWDFGVLKDTPGQSIYSTQPTPAVAAPPRQIPPLPEAKPRTATGGAGNPKSEIQNPKQVQNPK
jgi:hypothetical protein